MANCKYCGAKIVWAKSAKGKMMPFDKGPVDDGEWTLDNTGDGPVQARRAEAGTLIRYMPHWATCPGAEKARDEARAPAECLKASRTSGRDPRSGIRPRAFSMHWGFASTFDPAAPPHPAAPWLPVDRRYTSAQDGMSLPWHGRVWLNPPYGRETGKWVGRLREHGDGIAFVFSRVDTPWAQAALEVADCVCLVAGRVEFIPGAGASFKNGRSRSGAPSMLLAFGAVSARALAKSGLGVCLDARREPAWKLATL